ncbi:hypothetical protein BDA96_01G061800 [Sorghum bicolor]|uniref:FBD domain-containing protein n=2 Tax=Sorghum bicolor TaxID=4558 RepID=A0A921RVE2_SORBI|nr:hypothetical protein BDA96_01G061800 [Sorghum bicolor]OQU90849.1 hypothetical protein SORBI_3001G060401 [Sorghum bicolor]
MAAEAPPRCYRRLQKASDVSSVSAVAPSKRVRMGDRCTSHEDRISSLPDELDTRTTITTIILSKRWRDLPRRLPTSYNLVVDDILPPRYHHLKCFNMEASAACVAEKNMHKLTDIYAIKARRERWMATIRPLTAILERYERLPKRRYHAMSSSHCQVGQRDRYQNIRLERLVLSNCQPLCAWNCLTIQRLTKLTLGTGSYMGIISDILRNCIELRDFRITSSRKIKSLQVDWCCFGKIYLMSLPCLETFVCRGRPTKLSYSEVPRLRHVSLDYLQTEDNDIDDESGTSRTYPPSKVFKRIPLLDSLALYSKKLFIANVPVNGDVLWILLLLGAAAPALESFHIHIDNKSEQRSSGDLCDSLDADVQQHQNCRLKELVVAGFEGFGWQIGFARLIMKRSPLLRHVHLLDGEVRNDEQELGALQIVPRRRECGTSVSEL